MKLREAVPHGEILSFEPIGYSEDTEELRRSEYLAFPPDAQALKEWIQEEIDEGYLDTPEKIAERTAELSEGIAGCEFEDRRECMVHKMITSEGTYYLFAQSIDGHGSLTVVEEYE